MPAFPGILHAVFEKKQTFFGGKTNNLGESRESTNNLCKKAKIGPVSC